MSLEAILAAVLMGGMLVFIFPRMRDAVKNAPKGSTDDWKAAIIPILGVILFVILLIKIV
ncbi:MAG: hypothetical protein OEZ39_10365 [Gammaproteobacteria bacterium]|nr:hypothetical protein [Gammaproteobacteria bacterium]MDH5652245.1 hypothetical protein [Gammaproteobacteria bacterium]